MNWPVFQQKGKKQTPKLNVCEQCPGPAFCLGVCRHYFVLGWGFGVLLCAFQDCLSSLLMMKQLRITGKEVTRSKEEPSWGKSCPITQPPATAFKASAAGSNPQRGLQPQVQAISKATLTRNVPVSLRRPAWGREAAGGADAQGKAQGSRKLLVFGASGSSLC